MLSVARSQQEQAISLRIESVSVACVCAGSVGGHRLLYLRETCLGCIHGSALGGGLLAWWVLKFVDTVWHVDNLELELVGQSICEIRKWISTERTKASRLNVNSLTCETIPFIELQVNGSQSMGKGPCSVFNKALLWHVWSWAWMGCCVGPSRCPLPWRPAILVGEWSKWITRRDQFLAFGGATGWSVHALFVESDKKWSSIWQKTERKSL